MQFQHFFCISSIDHYTKTSIIFNTKQKFEQYTTKNYNRINMLNKYFYQYNYRPLQTSVYILCSGLKASNSVQPHGDVLSPICMAMQNKVFPFKMIYIYI